MADSTLTNASAPILNTNDLIPGNSSTSSSQSSSATTSESTSATASETTSATSPILNDAAAINAITTTTTSSSQIVTAASNATTTRFNVLIPVFDRKDKFRAFPTTPALAPNPDLLNTSNLASSSNINGDNSNLISTFQLPVENAVEINPILNIKNPRFDRVITFKRNRKFLDTTTNAEGVVGNTTNLASLPLENEDPVKTALRVTKNINRNTNNSFITPDLFERTIIQQNGNIRAMPRDRSQGLEDLFLRNKLLSSSQAVEDLSNPSVYQGTVSFVSFSSRDPGLPPIVSQSGFTGPKDALKSLL